MLRFAFQLSSWKPSKHQWLFSGCCVQENELERVNGFHFQNDAKATLIGRLLIRYALVKLTNVSWNKFKLCRTEKGKPKVDVQNTDSEYLEALLKCSFNISHQGDFVVAVVSDEGVVGIDVMDCTVKHGSVDKFFSLMNRNFTENEWTAINSPSTDTGKMIMFYRHWCLKESFVKGVGDGIGYSLKRLNFTIPTSNDKLFISPSQNTTLSIDGLLSDQWIFYEEILHKNHCVATAFCKSNDNKLLNFPDFQFLNIDVLHKFAKPFIDEASIEWFWNDYLNKPIKS